MNDLHYAQSILSDPQVRSLCLEALRDESRLEDALRQVYRLGFADMPDLEGAEVLFARRCRQIQTEYRRQRDACEGEPEQWLDRQLEIAEDPAMLFAALCGMTVNLHALAWQKDAFFSRLEQRMGEEALQEEDHVLLKQCVKTDLTGLFPSGYVPEGADNAAVPAQMLPGAAGILAMASYVAAKRCPAEGLPADLSFDAVCILSNAMTDILWQEEWRQRISAVTASVLAAQYMHVGSWPVMQQCAMAVPLLNRRFIGMLMNPVLELIREAASETWKIRKKILRFRREDVSGWLEQWHAQIEKTEKTQDKQLRTNREKLTEEKKKHEKNREHS